MAEWNETLEPYIKVQERIKSATQNPTAGDELIIGVAIVSDAGSGDPTLVRGQKEFVEKFASQEEVSSIAKLPNKEGLISMLLSCLQAPVRQFACTVKAVADAK